MADDSEGLEITRDRITKSLMTHFKMLSKNHLYGDIEFHFRDEPGIDAGGVRREVFELATKEVFGPEYGLF
eukprot:CAMPEP_0114577350 /NCGR_PEP_ID=MMETSP0125-20121206/2024_1 /TAXON_ID=485358 ORGANISM="Aristerostoma sp., Strain ATCC 50986" /NCGR_SAMPLE_ID=MMETSP0125 /ASSEMBLY_ACC=CAM_ASM_000245 /LENGTH=70 /DNA_ID=CAMNT_0001766601 /DNA_START=1524 /DNA_END=1736 /DNA_ORIENTATION=-